MTDHASAAEPLLCLDIGNTSAHAGLFAEGRITRTQDLPTARLGEELPGLLSAWPAKGMAVASVVPRATEAVARVLEHRGLPVFWLRHDNCPGLPIHYPRPMEIGQDRLANALGAQLLTDRPAIVIDLGTATTFDIISPIEGYLGGIIAPGLRLMTRYLHEQTALLPELAPEELIAFDPSSSVGKSTVEAMKLGCTIGFTGMIQALLNRLVNELGARHEGSAKVFLTGGAARWLLREVAPQWAYVPELTLQGLALGFRRWRALAETSAQA